jgi:hypothetical protein
MMRSTAAERCSVSWSGHWASCSLARNRRSCPFGVACTRRRLRTRRRAQRRDRGGAEVRGGDTGDAGLRPAHGSREGWITSACEWSRRLRSNLLSIHAARSAAPVDSFSAILCTSARSALILWLGELSLGACRGRPRGHVLQKVILALNWTMRPSCNNDGCSHSGP